MPPPADNPDQNKKLFGCWMHSREEDGEGRIVFRPFGYDFPPARGRQGFTLAQQGRVLGVGPGADDRMTETPAGSWSLRGDRLRIESPFWSGEFLIESAHEDKLVLRRENEE